MKQLIGLGLSLLSFSLTSVAQTYYIVRHAEKATNDSASMTNTDLPLSAEGKKRAVALKDYLKKKSICYIFSTNTLRTRATAEPLSKKKHIEIQYYGPRPDSFFLNQVKGLQCSMLIVGHSNTVDDIVNGLCGKQLLNDLPDAAYDNLFIVTKENGQFVFKQEKYGKKAPVRESKKRN